MASTLTTAKVATTVQSKSDLSIVSVTSTYTLAAALVVDDVIRMVKVPKGATIQGIVLSCTDLDTDVSPGIVLEAGDGGSASRFISASDIGQAGGVARLGVHGGHGYQYTAEDTIDVKVSTAPVTGATTGTITLTAIYSLDA